MHSIVKHLLVMAIVVGTWMAAAPREAHALGCTVGPCGRLENNTNVDIRVRYKNDDHDPYTERTVPAHSAMGGWSWSGGIDVDDWYVPEHCTDTYVWTGTGDTYTTSGPGWKRIDLSLTVKVTGRRCEAPPPPNQPPPQPSCAAPSGWPGTKYWIRIFATAPAYSGTSTSCGRVGENTTASNPQYIWCRRWGAEVRDGQGNYNHWWLWTDLDTGGRGWISAYYIQGQGNDQANDMNTGAPIAECR